jgi:hypothetical protein
MISFRSISYESSDNGGIYQINMIVIPVNVLYVSNNSEEEIKAESVNI